MNKRRTVLVGGCFDVLHFGHIQFLTQAKAQGDFLVVALESDQYILSVKKRKPFHTEKQRVEMLRALRMVDDVILLPFMKTDKEYFNCVQKIKPDIIAVTEGDPQYQNKLNQAKSIGAEVKVVTPLLEGFSTTNIFQHLS